jgi:hypothetical protein
VACAGSRSQPSSPGNSKEICFCHGRQLRIVPRGADRFDLAITTGGEVNRSGVARWQSLTGHVEHQQITVLYSASYPVQSCSIVDRFRRSPTRLDRIPQISLPARPVSRCQLARIPSHSKCDSHLKARMKRKQTKDARCRIV